GLLEGVVADPEQRLSELPLGAAAGAPEASRPRTSRRQRRAERQARLTPEQQALLRQRLRGGNAGLGNPGEK
ncbi:MAG: hypothetical protein GY835_24965, partial [bacterium]|nr:hypothetical protein [bacterium]